MSAILDCHLANDSETLEAHANVFDVWPMAEDLETHLAKRQVHPKMLRADYFVGTIEGRVAAALQSFPTNVLWEGEEVPCLQIGSVHTHADFRRRGYAEQLCDYVHKYQAERGLKLSILYSDVPQQYYSKMGYILCPAKMGYLNPMELSEGQIAQYNQLEKIEMPEEMSSLMELHEKTVRQRPIAILRDQAYWEYTLKKFPEDLFYGVKNDSGQWTAYIRLHESDEGYLIHDFLCQDDSQDLLQQLLMGMLRLGYEQGKTKVGGWLPENDAAKSLFELVDRPKQITMIRTLVGGTSLSEEVISTTNFFTQIDHV